MIKTKFVDQKQPIQFFTYKFIEDISNSVYEKISSELDLKPEEPSQGTEVIAWSNENEEILLEKWYGISFRSKNLDKVKEVLSKLGFEIES